MSTGLGRGLNSLIPQKINKTVSVGQGTAAPILASDEKGKMLAVPIESIKVNPMQPRRNFSENELADLSESIKQYGVIQPIIVTRSGDGYELIAGERRLRASKLSGQKTIPVIVREADKEEKLEIALIENIQRENLNPIETAAAYRRLMDEFSFTQEEVAKKVGKSRPSVANTLRLLSLPAVIQAALSEGRISEGHAKIIVGLESEAKQMALFRRVLHGGMTVDEANKETKMMGGTKQARVKINYQDKDKEFAFREFFGTKVEIRRKGKGGQVIIDFFSDEELDQMTRRIKN